MTCAEQQTNALDEVLTDEVNSLFLFAKEILVHVWTSVQNTSNAIKRNKWVPKTRPQCSPWRIGKDDAQLDTVISFAINEVLCWSCHEHSQTLPKALWDSRILALSNKAIKKIMGGRPYGEPTNGETKKPGGVVGFTEICTKIDTYRENYKRHARRMFFKDISINAADTECGQSMNDFFLTRLGHAELAEIILIYGVPSILQANNATRWRVLSHSTAEREDLGEFTREFLGWWGCALQCLDSYSRTPRRAAKTKDDLTCQPISVLRCPASYMLTPLMYWAELLALEWFSWGAAHDDQETWNSSQSG